jgi:hypothetical protein
VAVTDKIDQSIEELIGQLASADNAESVRIRARIHELKALKEQSTT